MISVKILLTLTAVLYVVRAQPGSGLGLAVDLPPGAFQADLPGPPPGALPAEFPGAPGVGVGHPKGKLPYKKHVPNFNRCDLMSYDEEDQWVCPEKDYFEVTDQYLEGQLEAALTYDLTGNYEYAMHIADTGSCHNGWDKKNTTGENSVYKYEKLCNTERKEIQYVYDYYEYNKESYQDVCVVFPGQWLYSVKCTHPEYYKRRGNRWFGKRYHNFCKIGYAYIQSYRCLPYGFVDRKVVVWCRDQQKLKWFHKRIATTCSCMQCPNGCKYP